MIRLRFILVLTVRSSDNILQKSILRGHKSPPTPRHSASTLRRPQVNRSAPCSGSSWLSAAHRRCGDVAVRGCLSAFLISSASSSVRCGTFRHAPSSSRRRKQRMDAPCRRGAAAPPHGIRGAAQPRTGLLAPSAG